MRYLASVLLLAATRPAAERVVTGDGIMEARINGRSVRLRIDPAAPGMPVVSKDVAERLGLGMRGSFGLGVAYSVGGTVVDARTVVVRLDLGAGEGKRRIGSTARPFAAAADGSIGPDALPEPVVRFRLHAPAPGERTVTFPAVRPGGAFGLFSHFGATFAEIEVGGQPMRIRFDPHHPRTLATAGAAVRLARFYDGAVSGKPAPTEIFFGVERPVRTLTLGRPFPIGSIAITALGVRTSDFGSAAAIREATAPAERTDPDEVVVTGRGAKRDVRRDTVSLGADYLRRCSEIVFDKPARVIRLTCG